MELEVRNRFNVQKRDISIYHHHDRSARVVSPGASTGVFLDTGAGGDYLYLSLVKGLSDLWKEGWILVPHCIEFDFSYKGNFRLRYGTKGKLVKLIIPQGLNTWELKLTLPNKDCLIEKIIVCGDGPEPEMVN